MANRIANCSFTLGGATYDTPCNEFSAATGRNDTLHGGTVGWDRQIWAASQLSASTLALSLTSPDGDMGFPSSVAATVTYSLDEPAPGGAASEGEGVGAWTITYEATNTGSAATPVALTQHAYWMLSGFQGGVATVLGHVLQLPNSSRFEAVDAGLIPTGALTSVGAAPWMDFRAPKAVGTDIVNGSLPSGYVGYDNSFLFDGWAAGQAAVPRVVVTAPDTGLTMVVSTDQPAVQVYSGNFLNSSACCAARPARDGAGGQRLGLATRACSRNPTPAPGPHPLPRCRAGIPRKASQGGPGETYPQYSALALEAQQYIGAVNQPAFPSVTLAPGQTYRQTTSYAFFAGAPSASRS